MNLGALLGSISPGFGAITGQGLGGMARNLSPMYLMARHGGAERLAMAPVTGAAGVMGGGGLGAAMQGLGAGLQQMGQEQGGDAPELPGMEPFDIRNYLGRLGLPR